jgi:predicted RNA-binding Zn-ribbon protein involved in translation (DUF1610 family)
MGKIHVHWPRNFDITNIFRHTNLIIAFHSKNTIENLLTHKTHIPNIYRQSGAYKLTCPDCGKAYVGHTSREFTTRYKQHKTAFRTNNRNYSFAKHLMDTGHSFGPINEIMSVLHCHRKGIDLNSVENFYIHAEARHNNHLNDDHTFSSNAIFDTLLKQKHFLP